MARNHATSSPEDCCRQWDTIEQELLNGQKLQGTLATQELFQVLHSHEILEEYPLFSMIYDIAFQGRSVADITSAIHPVEHPHPALYPPKQLLVGC